MYKFAPVYLYGNNRLLPTPQTKPHIHAINQYAIEGEKDKRTEYWLQSVAPD